MGDPRAEFDEKRRADLLGVLDSLGLAASAKDDLMFRAQWAVDDLMAARASAGSADDDETQLDGLLNAARALAQAWGAINANTRLRGSFDNRLKGLLPLSLDHRKARRSDHGREAADPAELARHERLAEVEQLRIQGLPNEERHAHALEEQMRRRERVARLDQVLGEDLWWMIGEIRPLRAALKAASAIRNSAEYACVRLVASAWLDNTGEVPTLTRNAVAVAGKQATPFQRFSAEAVPPPAIGQETIRLVVDGSRRSSPRLGAQGTTKIRKR